MSDNEAKTDELDELSAPEPDKEEQALQAEQDEAKQQSEQDKAQAAAQAVHDQKAVKAAAKKAREDELRATAKAAGRPVTAKPAQNVVIMNTTKRMISLPRIKGADGANIYDTQRLIPGQNDVPSGHWDAVAENPSVKISKACKDLKCIGAGKAERLDKGLDALTPDSARMQIARCSDIDMLSKFRAGTKVEEFHKLIDARKAELILEA